MPGVIRDCPEPEHTLAAVGSNEIPRVLCTSFAPSDSLHLKVAVKNGLKLSAREVSETRNQPVGWQNDQSRVAHAHEHHENKIRRCVLIVNFACVTPVIQVRESCLVAMMSVCNK